MKLFLSLLFAFISFQALAVSKVCDQADGSDFRDKLTKSISSKTGPGFNKVERSMIYKIMTLEAWREVKTEYQAVRQFMDYNDYDSNPGTNAGEINYFKLGNKTIALVHFWPGDNEYGALFELSAADKFILLAYIQDGDLDCSL
jgi:hypothetical protein